MPIKLEKLTEQTLSDDFLLVIPNPSEVQGKFGWPLRNLIAAIAYLRYKNILIFKYRLMYFLFI
jgi:hypothetical protein